MCVRNESPRGRWETWFPRGVLSRNLHQLWELLPGSQASPPDLLTTASSNPDCGLQAKPCSLGQTDLTLPIPGSS